MRVKLPVYNSETFTNYFKKNKDPINMRHHQKIEKL